MSTSTPSTQHTADIDTRSKAIRSNFETASRGVDGQLGGVPLEHLKPVHDLFQQLEDSVCGALRHRKEQAPSNVATSTAKPPPRKPRLGGSLKGLKIPDSLLTRAEAKTGDEAARGVRGISAFHDSEDEDDIDEPSAGKQRQLSIQANKEIGDESTQRGSETRPLSTSSGKDDEDQGSRNEQAPAALQEEENVTQSTL